MQYTSNYNLMLPEGTDIVNLLTQLNPNISDIDAAMFANKQMSVGRATESTVGTVHAITRANQDSPIFAFTATSNWTQNDTMSVDGVACSVYLTDGTQPETGAYVINSEVFAILNGTRVTLLTNAAPNIVIPDNTALIATPQDTLVAVRNYNPGEQFAYQNDLYKVTSAILAGNIITIGTNAELAGNVTEQIKSAGAFGPKTTLLTSPVNMVYRESDTLVEIILVTSGTYTSSSEVSIGTLPANLLPFDTLYMICEGDVIVRFEVGGDIKFKGSNQYARGHIIYSKA